ncbi:MAG TPA: hypothetical protein VMS60_13520 [Solirubrobacterales bacterium]|nr:hypothetical protein [Solirubrobacterales bacterium]
MARRLSTIALSIAVLGALAAAPAQASFHLMKIREVFAGSSANPDAAYVELQMYAGGQNFVAGHSVRIYDANGNEVDGVPFPANVARGDSQSTLLVATTQAATQFGVIPDATLEAGKIKATGGAVCFDDLDCVAWGATKFAGPAGTPAGAIPDGLALQRMIGRGCATALDPADDSDDSAADFVAVAPAPRPNSFAPPEQLCGGTAAPGTGGSKAGEHGDPQTTLRGKPAKRTTDRTPTFKFTASEKGAKFECKLDGKAFRACRSPYTTKSLALGPHTFRVRAVVDGHHTDASPATFRFTVVAKKRG